MDWILLLLDPRVWVMFVIALALGFVGGCMDEQDRFESWKRVAQAAGEAQERVTTEINRRNQELRKNIDANHKNEVASLRGDLAAADKRLSDNSGRGFVPRPSAGAGVPLQPRASCSETERTYIAGIYRGDIVCYRSEELDRGVRKIVDEVRGRSAELALAAVDALDDRKWWGEWSAGSGACRANN